MDSEGNIEEVPGPSNPINHVVNGFENPVHLERYTKLPDTPASKKLPALNHAARTPNVNAALPPIQHSANLDKKSYPKYHQRLEYMPKVSTPTGSVVGSIAGSSIRSDMSRTRYEAESPDELALVRAASTYNCCLKGRTAKTVIVWLPGELIQIHTNIFTVVFGNQVNGT